MTLEFGKSIPMGDWKEGWRGKSGKDTVLFNADEALVGIDFLGRCPSHHRDTFCLECLPRLKEIVAAAQAVIDPEVPAVAEEISASSENLPEYIALVNPIAKNAFAMRLQKPTKMVARKPIYTTRNPEHKIPGLITVVKYVNRHQVCDCAHLRGFYVRLGDGLSSEYAKRFWDARLTFSVDGSRLIDQVRVGELLPKKEVVFQDTGDKNCLFLACAVSEVQEVDRKDFLGYMTPSGTTFLVELENIPGGGGLVHLEVGWNLPEYTTGGFKERKLEAL